MDHPEDMTDAATPHARRTVERRQPPALYDDPENPWADRLDGFIGILCAVGITAIAGMLLYGIL